MNYQYANEREYLDSLSPDEFVAWTVRNIQFLAEQFAAGEFDLQKVGTCARFDLGNLYLRGHQDGQVKSKQHLRPMN